LFVLFELSNQEEHRCARASPLYSARTSPLLHGDLSRAHRAHSLWITPNYSKSTASVHWNPHTVFVSTNLLTSPHYNTTNTVLLPTWLLV